MIELVQVRPPVALAVISLGDHGDLAHLDSALAPLTRVSDWPHDDTADAFRPLVDYPGQTGPGTFLIVRDGVVVGDCGWFGPPDEDGESEIGYGVAPSARRQGVAAAAVPLLVAWTREQRARSVRAEVLPDNLASLGLLAKLGFTDVGERAGHRLLVL